MPNEHEIKSEKIFVKEIFSKMWFRIPEYQRPYIWSKDEVTELLNDLLHAKAEKEEQEYFLGSFVFQTKRAESYGGQRFDENDLLDGQQRLTTLLILFACLRDLTDHQTAKENCQASIYQKGDEIDGIPERTRIVFAIRPVVQKFIDEFVKADGGTKREIDLRSRIAEKADSSIPNIAQAILEIRRYLQDPENQVPPLPDFLKFIRNRVLLIYVATENLDDAFRLFTILNDRGVPLRNSDILKSRNLGELEKESDRENYARMWEKAEGELGDGFDRFLNYLRTILVKDKIRLNLLQEFEAKIYSPKEKDKVTGQTRKPLLGKGKPTFQFVETYLSHYNALVGQDNYDETGWNFRFDNLMKVMLTGLPSTDWMPPLLRYFDRFKYDQLAKFLVALDNKFSADWICQYTPTERIDHMNKVIKLVEDALQPSEVLTSDCFAIDKKALSRTVDSAVYGYRFTRYLLLKLDFLYQDHAHRMAFENLSVEHVLPQHPGDDSQWRCDFTDEQRKEWTDRLGNLVLISCKKNTSQGRVDYADKKKKYFSKNINTCPNSLRVLQSPSWRLADLMSNHQTVIHKLMEHYGVA